MVLKELLLEIYTYGHFRIYEPNRDCLMWESFRKIHAPMNLEKDSKGHVEWDWFSHNDYYNNNPYVEPLFRFEQSEYALDEQTCLMLEKYGDYKVFRMELSNALMEEFYTDKNNKLKVKYHHDDYGNDRTNCLEIYIIYDTEGAGYGRIK